MLRADFYFIPQPGPQARLLFACRLLEKVYQQGQSIYVQLENAEKMRFFDQLLWTFRDDSFIPHQVGVEPGVPHSPIQLGFLVPPDAEAGNLLNLQDDIPAGYDRFQRILEILPSDAATALKAEKHRVFYQEKGYTIHSHHIQSARA